MKMWRSRRIRLAATWCLCFLLLSPPLTYAQDVSPINEEALLSVADLESRSDPLTPEDRIRRSPEHVVTLEQVGEATFRVGTPQHPPQRIDFSEEGNGHFIEAVWIRRVGTDDVIFYENVTEMPGTIGTEFRPWEALLNETVESRVEIQAYMWCNLHGLWVSPVVTMVPPIYWRIAAGENVQEECLTVPGVALFTSQQRASILITTGVEAATEIEAEAEAPRVVVHFSMPVGSYLSVGLNSEFFMIGTMAVVARGLTTGNPDARFYNLVSRERSQVRPMQSPLPVVQNLSVANGTVELVASFVVTESQLDHKMMFAFGMLDGSNLLQHEEQGLVNVPEGGGVVTLTPRKLFSFAAPGQNSSVGGGACQGTIMAAQCSSTTSNKRDVQLTHGVLMFIIWSFNITVGVFVARYERHTTWWLHVHKFLQLLCSITTIPVYIIGFVAAESAEHFTTMHGRLGLAIAVISSLQVASGFAMYRSAKMSRRLLHYLVAHPKVPTKLRESLVNDFEKRPQNTILLLNEFAARQDPSWLTLERQKEFEDVDLAKIIKNFIMQHYFHDRIFYRHVVPLRRSVIIPMHHWLGRGLLILVYVQMYIGVELVNIEPFVQHCFYGWVAILALLFSYKEVLLQKRKLCGASQGAAGSKCPNSCTQSGNYQLESKPRPNPGQSSDSASATSRRRRNRVEDDDAAVRYTKSFFKDKRNHEKKIFSIHNFVGNNTSNRTLDIDTSPLTPTKQTTNGHPTTTAGSARLDVEKNKDGADPESQKPASVQIHADANLSLSASLLDHT